MALGLTRSFSCQISFWARSRSKHFLLRASLLTQLMQLQMISMIILLTAEPL